MFEINGVIWRILIVSSNHPALKMPNGGWAIGCCNTDNNTIYLSEEVGPKALQRELLIHEIAHAAIASYGYSLPLDQEEFLVSFIQHHGDEIFLLVDTIIRELF